MTDRVNAILGELREFVRERDWEQFHDPKNLAMAVVSEAGELAAEYRWVRSDEADNWASVPANGRRVTAEAADVGIALLLFCDRLGVDLIEAMRQKIEVNRRNYPVGESRGYRERPVLKHSDTRSRKRERDNGEG